MENELLFSLSQFGEFGQKRFQATLQPLETIRIPILCPEGRWWLVYQIRFGNITADQLNFRFNNIRNYFEENILIGTELLNHPIDPKPYLSISGRQGEIVVENTDAAEAHDFSIVLLFVLMDKETAGKVRKMSKEAWEKLEQSGEVE